MRQSQGSKCSNASSEFIGVVLYHHFRMSYHSSVRRAFEGLLSFAGSLDSFFSSEQLQLLSPLAQRLMSKRDKRHNRGIQSKIFRARFKPVALATYFAYQLSSISLKPQTLENVMDYNSSQEENFPVNAGR